jgi:hypothetical protein
MGILAAPSVLLAALSLFVAVLWLFTFPWLPAVIAVEGSDVLDAAGKLVNLALRRPQGLLGHGILMLILAILLSGAWIALVATATHVGVGCLLRPVVAPWGHAQDLAAAARGLVCACDQSPVSTSSFVAQFAAFLMKISVGAMGLIALGYPLVFWGCSTPLSYGICRYRLDRIALEKVVEDADEVMPDLPSRRPEGG